MSNSNLVNYTKLSLNHSGKKSHKIDKITIHHMAGNLSVESCGRVFANANRQASANYGIDSSGRVGLYVDEANRAWTSSNAANDNRAITIEVANDGGAPDWHVSDTALAKLIDLCVDICKRNGISKLIYTGDTNGNLTRHNMFKATTCPGPYLQSKFPYIAEEVNKRLGSNAVPENKYPSYIETVARMAIAGKFGNGDERRRKIEAMGYNYREVQNEVNRLLGIHTAPVKAKSVHQIAKEVIQGKYGNGAARKANIEALGYNYREVQNEVNKML